LTGTVAGPAAGAGVALAGAYKKELLTLLQTKGPSVLIGLLKSKGKLDVVGILSAKLLGKHALPFYAPAKLTTESEQKTVAKTWDQMTPQEKSSGIKGRTVWNEKTQRYYTVFDVPAKQETDEGWLKNTAAGLALGAAAIGGAQAGTSMDDPSWHSGQYASHVKSDHTIQKQTGSPSVHQKRISDVTGPNADGEYRVTVTQNGKIASQYITKTPPPDWMMKEQDLDEASLATMRDYFAGDENARDPYDITKQRLHFSKDKNARPTVDKRFRSPAEYQAWLKQNKLQQISGANESTNNKGWSLTNKRKQ